MEILGLGEIHADGLHAIIIVLRFCFGFQRKRQSQDNVLRKSETRENMDRMVGEVMFQEGEVPARLAQRQQIFIWR